MPIAFAAAQEQDAGAPETVDVTEAQPPDAADVSLDAAKESDAANNETETASAAGSVDADAVSKASVAFIRIKQEKKLTFLQRLGFAFAIIALQALLIRFIWFLFKRINIKLESSSGKDKIKPVNFRKYKLLTVKQVVVIIEVFLRLLKYIITGILLFITLPVIFSLFEATRNYAAALFGYILNPLKDIAVGAVNFIPNLIKIIIIAAITHYVLKGVKYFAVQIEKEKLKIPGFYVEWAHPTYKIFQVLLWAFTVAVIYPFLPFSDSRAFQGVSVFVGIIFSLGSSSAIGNLVAGLVITYMRPFKIGDRVKINDVIGFIVEKNLMVVRVKTHKNEYVTFPNLIILNSNTVNYNTSSDEDEEGLIIHAEVTFGYATPWQTVHEILIKAALTTDYVQKKPKPFVLQTALDDFYARYQINCYTKEVGRIPGIYAMLYENIQNGFRDAGFDLTSTHYNVNYIKKDTN